MAEGYSIKSIINEYRNRIYRLALSISRNEKDAEDILQNTFIKIIRKLHTFRSRSRLSTWIYRISYNESLMYLRKKRGLFNSLNAYKNYVERLPYGLTVNWSKLPDEELVDSEFRERIDTTLKNIPIQYRMPLLLHRLEGFSLAESSRILGVKASTIKTRLHRAYLMVKDQINDYFKDLPQQKPASDARCGIWTGFLFNYAQGKVSPEIKTSFKRHIKDCPRCNSFLDLYLQAIRITGALDCRDVPDELKERLETFLTPAKKS